MKLERMDPLPRDPARVQLQFADGTQLRTTVTLAADFGLYAGRDLDESELAALQLAVRKAGARQRAVRIVSAAAVSEAELEKRLIQKGEDPEDAAEAVRWLQDLGAVNDRELAGRVARQAAAKGYGPARIRQALYQKGIPRALWDEAMADLPEPDDAIDRFLQQRLGGTWPDRKTLQKTTDALVRRGHSREDIRSALARYRESLEASEPADFPDEAF